ncbi:MAG: hypothetical protein E7214_09795 [Clostridium sp.]|nr:hypothetical protein [Clostridium sp.]
MSYMNFQCNINLKENPLNLNIDNFCSVALRNNKKRRFLFVSKVLGKHIPVEPEKCLELGKLLAKEYRRKVQDDKDKPVVIGFAETATALGHSFFDSLEEAEFFVNTTREEVKGLKKLEFKEEHSHATEQILYYDKNLNYYGDKIILVDDEITTAKTCINIIAKLRKVSSIKKYTIVSILNWIDEEREKEINQKAKEFDCTIDFVYLFRGSFDFKCASETLKDKIENIRDTQNNIEVNYIDLKLERYSFNIKYLSQTGRFGLSRLEHKRLKESIGQASEKLNVKSCKGNILALGVEEFMYIPMLLSNNIEGNVYFHSITRSPIIPMEDYIIKSKYKFKSFYNDNENYLYNLNSRKYDECFLFLEVCKDKERIDKFINIIKYLNIPKINIVRC